MSAFGHFSREGCRPTNTTNWPIWFWQRPDWRVVACCTPRETQQRNNIDAIEQGRAELNVSTTNPNRGSRHSSGGRPRATRSRRVAVVACCTPRETQQRNSDPVTSWPRLGNGEAGMRMRKRGVSVRASIRAEFSNPEKSRIRPFSLSGFVAPSAGQVRRECSRTNTFTGQDRSAAAPPIGGAANESPAAIGCQPESRCELVAHRR